MSDIGDKIRIEQTISLIDDMEYIISKYSNISFALKEVESQYALMMCLAQIGENIGKIKSDKIRKLLPVKEAAATRNIIIYSYDNLDLSITESTIVANIPELKRKLTKILEDFKDFT